MTTQIGRCHQDAEHELVDLSCDLGKGQSQVTSKSVTYLRDAIRYGFRSHLRLSLSQITTQVDQFVLGILMTPADLGCHAVAASLREGLLLLPESISVVLFPWVAGNQANAAATTARVSRVTLLLMVLAAGTVAIVAVPLVGLLYGKSFLPAVGPLYFLLVAS